MAIFGLIWCLSVVFQRVFLVYCGPYVLLTAKLVCFLSQISQECIQTAHSMSLQPEHVRLPPKSYGILFSVQRTGTSSFRAHVSTLHPEDARMGVSRPLLGISKARTRIRNKDTRIARGSMIRLMQLYQPRGAFHRAARGIERHAHLICGECGGDTGKINRLRRSEWKARVGLRFPRRVEGI